MLLPLILISAALNVHAVAPDVIYGEDNRVDTVESRSAFHKQLAAGTAAQILRADIPILRAGKGTFEGQILNDFIKMKYGPDLCDGERFKEQVAFANCSGFLVAPDILVSAGHCFQANECESHDWVFNYKTAKADDLTVTINEEDIYSCDHVISMKAPRRSGDQDYAVIKLMKKVKGVKPLKVARATPGVGTPLVLIGHPSGLPQKIADGATVKKMISTGFEANVDAFGGNSGSAVFNERTGEVVGILVNGEEDYSLDSAQGCMKPAYLSQDKGGEGVSGVEQFLPHL